MKVPTFDEYMSKQGSDSDTGKREYFLIERCPTPGCGTRVVRPIWKNGLISGFTCNHGCRYRVKRNSLTGEIDFYELERFNHYTNDSASTGHRVKFNGEPVITWF